MTLRITTAENRSSSVSFLLGPPADPELLARFEWAQHTPAPSEGGAQDSLTCECLHLEPRLGPFVAPRDGQPSLLSEGLSLVLKAKVEVVDPVLSFGFMKGHRVASLQLRPDHLRGPAESIVRLFGESGPAGTVGALLGYVLKLDWVCTTRTLD